MQYMYVQASWQVYRMYMYTQYIMVFGSFAHQLRAECADCRRAPSCNWLWLGALLASGLGPNLSIYGVIMAFSGTVMSASTYQDLV